MTYQPTKEELEEIGFIKVGVVYVYELTDDIVESRIIIRNNMEYLLEVKGITHELYTHTTIYPQSLEDLKTLIRILTTQ